VLAELNNRDLSSLTRIGGDSNSINFFHPFTTGANVNVIVIGASNRIPYNKSSIGLYFKPCDSATAS